MEKIVSVGFGVEMSGLSGISFAAAKHERYQKSSKKATLLNFR
jgi:hypothetical protein